MAVFFILSFCFHNGFKVGQDSQAGRTHGKTLKPVSRAIGLEMGFYTLGVSKGHQVIQVEVEKSGQGQR